MFKGLTFRMYPNKEQQKNNIPFTPVRGIGGVGKDGRPMGFAANIDNNSKSLFNKSSITSTFL